jgi:hypothetical protein
MILRRRALRPAPNELIDFVVRHGAASANTASIEAGGKVPIESARALARRLPQPSAPFGVYAVPIEPGRRLPALPPAGLPSMASAAELPGAQRRPQARAFPGAEPSTYAFPRLTTHRNIYRIPVP